MDLLPSLLRFGRAVSLRSFIQQCMLHEDHWRGTALIDTIFLQVD